MSASKTHFGLESLECGVPRVLLCVQTTGPAGCNRGQELDKAHKSAPSDLAPSDRPARRWYALPGPPPVPHRGRRMTEPRPAGALRSLAWCLLYLVLLSYAVATPEVGSNASNLTNGTNTTLNCTRYVPCPRGWHSRCSIVRTALCCSLRTYSTSSTPQPRHPNCPSHAHCS